MQSKKLLVIGLTWPEPTATAAGVRMMQLLQMFQEYDFETIFISSASKTDASEDLEALGITCQHVSLNSLSFDEFIKDLDPNVVLFDRFLTEEQFGWRVAEHCPRALRILDTEDLHSLRHVREQCQKNKVLFSNELWMQSDKTKREVASILRSDLSLIISTHEMELLQQVLKIDSSLLWYLPFMFDEIPKDVDWPGFETRRDFILIGGGKHPPNVDAIKYLKHDIWPKIYERLSNTKCYVYGAYLPESILQLHQPKNGFYVRGKARKVSEVLSIARVCLAPLRFGAGIKGKLVDAMRYGTPSVTTQIGAEGMHGNMEWNGFVTDDEDVFVEKAIQLYNDKTVWQKAQDNGINIINTLYHKPKLEKLLMDRIKELMEDLEPHRTQNFMGRLLEHHTLQSTKYMSKWIEEKNKKPSN